MNFYRCGDRVKLTKKSVFFFYFDAPTAVVVGYGTTQAGVPSLMLSMDEQVVMVGSIIPREFTEKLVVPMDVVEPL